MSASYKGKTLAEIKNNSTLITRAVKALIF